MQPGISYKVCPYCNEMYDVSKKHDCLAKRKASRERHKAYAKREKAVGRPLHTKHWHYLRQRIIAADGGYCQRCWIKYHVKTYQHLEVHHIKPRIKYPKLIFDSNNLITLCHTCNAQLGIQPKLDFKWSPKDRKFKHLHYSFAL